MVRSITRIPFLLCLQVKIFQSVGFPRSARDKRGNPQFSAPPRLRGRFLPLGLILFLAEC
jgi:hypothetical protein